MERDGGGGTIQHVSETSSLATYHVYIKFICAEYGGDGSFQFIFF